MLAYFFLIKEKHKPLFLFVYLGISYFLISAINYNQIEINNYLIKEFVRFMILVICGAEVVRNARKKDIYLIILIGALTIIIHAFIFPLANANFYPTYGRYSGFYLNPNFGGAICLIGYALSFSFKKHWKLAGQIVFSLGGLLTFSRTFIVVWLLISLLSIIKDRKNLIVPLIGSFMLILIFVFSNKLTLNTERFGALEGIFSGSNAKTEVLNKDTRPETWAIYYNQIFDKPFLGHGFESFQRKQPGLPGVHNSYLMILGESGVFPFLIFIGIYALLILRSLKVYQRNPEYLYLSCVLVLYMMASHTYFSNYYIATISMFIFIRLKSFTQHMNHIR
jgi:O-antigen ligase